MLLNEPVVVTLNNGEAVVASHRQTLVKAGNCDVYVTSGTIAMVTRQGDVTTVRVLYDNSADSVRLVHNGKIFALTAGQEAILGPANGAVNASMKADLVGRRRVRLIDLPDGYSLARCEVSLVSLMQEVDVLKRIVNSKEGSDKALLEKLVKMAAVVQQTQMSHGNYAPINP